MSVGSVAAGVRTQGSDQQDAATSYYVKLARANGIDPKPLTDIDAARRERMSELLGDVATAKAVQNSGTDDVEYAQARWNDRANAYGASIFIGLAAAAGVSVLTAFAASGAAKVTRLGGAAAIAAVAATLIGVPTIGILSSRAERREDLEQAKAAEQRINGEDAQDLEDAIDAAKAYAATVRADPTEPVT
jgi:hypothetical protein